MCRKSKRRKCKLIINGCKFALCEGCKIYWNIPWQDSEKGYKCPDCEAKRKAKGGGKDDKKCNC